MDLWDFVRLLFRWWFVTLPLLALTAGAGYYAAQGVAPTSTASAVGVFLAPPVAVDPTRQVSNPWLEAGVPTTASAIVENASAPVTQGVVERAGFSKVFTIKLASRSVLFTISADAPTSAQATGTLDYVLGLMRTDLRQKQDAYDVPEGQQIKLQLVSQASVVETRDSVKRVLLVVIGLGAILTALVVFVTDSLVQRRRVKRRSGTSVAESSSGSSPRSDWDNLPEAGDDEADSSRTTNDEDPGEVASPNGSARQPVDRR